MIIEIGDSLEKDGFGKQGKDILIGKSNENDNIVVLYETGGNKAPEIVCDIEYPTCQVYVRDKSYLNGWNRIQSIYKYLHGNPNIFMLIEAIQSPVSIGRDNKDRAEFTCNFRAIKEI